MIPNVFHFCYALLPEAEFGLFEYLAIKSAYEVNRPERIYLHYQHECSGAWWEMARKLVTFRKIEAPTEIFGRALHHFAHRSDVLRLQLLQEHGGIYLDIDTICLRPFSDLLGHSCVLGWQGDRGLCNAVILSEPQGQFVQAWLESYRAFRSTGRDKHWDEHSVLMPARLARDPRLASHIAVLSDRAFFFPLWKEMRHLFDSDDLWEFGDSYCVHYWETYSRDRLRQITPEQVISGNTNLARFARRVLLPEFLLESIEPRVPPPVRIDPPQPIGVWRSILKRLPFGTRASR